MKNSRYVPTPTDFSMTRFLHQNRQFLAGGCLLAALFLFPCATSLAYSGGGSYGGMTGGDGLPTEADCRSCHDDLIGFPFLNETNVNKHHLLIGSPIILSTIPPGAEPGEIYECLFCHPLDTVISDYTLSLFRDCLVCHPVETVSGPPRMQHGSNRHHELGYRCSVCHVQRR